MEKDRQHSKKKNDTQWFTFLNALEQTHKNVNTGKSTTEISNTTPESNSLFSTKVLPCSSISEDELDRKLCQFYKNRMKGVKAENGDKSQAQHYQMPQSQPQQKNQKYSYTNKNYSYKNEYYSYENKTKHDSIILDTDIENRVEHQSTLSDNSNYFITKSTNYQEENVILPSNDLITACDYNSPEVSSDLNKLQMMTAKQNSVIPDTDVENCVENQSTLSENSNYSITKSTTCQEGDVILPSNDLIKACDYNFPEVSGDLNKLQMMTAKDFNSDRYARYGIHESEMKDYVRSISYQTCIEYCAEKYIKNKVVLVIRSGIGLLPMLCIRNGHAKIVIGLEQSACIEYARRIVKDNLYSHKITFIQSSVYDLKDLPFGLKEVDVIISDFIGDCVLSQGDLMEQVIEARDRFLKPNGLMIPICVALYSQLLEQRSTYENQRIRKYKNKKNDNITSKTKLDQFEVEDYDTDSSSDSTWCSSWSNVYGFDMRSKPDIILDHNSEDGDSDKVEWCVMEEPLVTFFDPCKVVSTSCLMKEFDMYKCTIADVRLVQCKDLRFKCVTPFTSATGGDYAHMLEMFMVVDFPNGYDSSNNTGDLQIGFSTSSFSPLTHYRQTGLLLRDQLPINKGDEFIINEFHMWRGDQKNQVNNPFEKTSINRNSCNISQHEENIKLRLRYTFVNKYIKAINRRCAYTITRNLF